MTEHRHATRARPQTQDARPAPCGILQRKCSCAGTAGPTGDCADCRRRRKLGVQPKLRVSQPGDPWEREADRVADRVMRMSEPASYPVAGTSGILRAGRGDVARQIVDVPENEEEEIAVSDLLSMQAEPGADPPSRAAAGAELQSMRVGGRALDRGVRAFFEPRLGYDFSRVRVHTDARAAESARALNARAFTLGRNIVFAAGKYRPDNDTGRALIAHELVHVMQQGADPQTIMRACDCSTVAGARAPSSSEETSLQTPFPHLQSGDWCVLGPKSSTYNCIAWTVGDTSQWIWNQVDTAGDGDGTVTISDFDSFYLHSEGLLPSTAPSSNSRVALFAKGGSPTHAARLSTLSPSCGSVPFTSKLGRSLLVSHDLYQLEGGPVYGDVVRYYDA